MKTTDITAALRKSREGRPYRVEGPVPGTRKWRTAANCETPQEAVKLRALLAKLVPHITYRIIHVAAN